MGHDTVVNVAVTLKVNESKLTGFPMEMKKERERKKEKEKRSDRRKGTDQWLYSSTRSLTLDFRSLLLPLLFVMLEPI